MSTVLVTIHSVTVPAGASVIFAHELSVNATGVIPDEVEIDRLGAGLDVDPANVTDTTVQVDNSGLVAVTANILTRAWHTYLRAFTTGGASAFVGLTPQPFVQTAGGGGGGGGGSGDPERFSVVMGGGEGSEFDVVLPTARLNATYLVFTSQKDVTSILGIDTNTYTPLQFHVSLSASVAAGDVLSFYVVDPT